MDRTEKYGRSGLLASPQRAAAFFSFSVSFSVLLILRSVKKKNADGGKNAFLTAEKRAQMIAL